MGATNVLLRGLIVIPLMLLLIIVMWVAGMIVPPIADEVLTRAAVQSVGFDTGIDVSLKVGLQWGVPTLGAGLCLWWIYGGLTTDVRDVPQRRGRR